MNNRQIINMLDDLFYGIPETDKVREQKEELRIHFSDMVNERMADGLTFDEAFKKAKSDMGDLDELISEFKSSGDKLKSDIGNLSHAQEEYYNNKYKKITKLYKAERRRKFARAFGWMHKIASITPFIYIFMGIMMSGWRVWALGWMIIPCSFIVAEAFSKGKFRRLLALTPFIYIYLGSILGTPFWFWGWIIIPVAYILFDKSKKPNISIKMDFDRDEIFPEDEETLDTDDIIDVEEIIDDSRKN